MKETYITYLLIYNFGCYSIWETYYYDKYYLGA
jgi:hypothetical protein